MPITALSYVLPIPLWGKSSSKSVSGDLWNRAEEFSGAVFGEQRVAQLVRTAICPMGNARRGGGAFLPQQPSGSDGFRYGAEVLRQPSLIKPYIDE
jgi:hypothetical protein